jgi:hypothetical protein
MCRLFYHPTVVRAGGLATEMNRERDIHQFVRRNSREVNMEYFGAHRVVLNIIQKRSAGGVPLKLVDPGPVTEVTMEFVGIQGERDSFFAVAVEYRGSQARSPQTPGVSSSVLGSLLYV